MRRHNRNHTMNPTNPTELTAKTPEQKGRDFVYGALGLVLIGAILVSVLAEVALAVWLVRWIIGGLSPG